MDNARGKGRRRETVSNSDFHGWSLHLKSRMCYEQLKRPELLFWVGLYWHFWWHTMIR